MTWKHIDIRVLSKDETSQRSYGAINKNRWIDRSRIQLLICISLKWKSNKSHHHTSNDKYKWSNEPASQTRKQRSLLTMLNRDSAATSFGKNSNILEKVIHQCNRLNRPWQYRIMQPAHLRYTLGQHRRNKSAHHPSILSTKQDPIL